MNLSVNWSQKSNLITYGLLSLAYILVIALFITVFSQNSTSGNELASKRDLVSLNSSVGAMASKMTQIEKDVKKITTCETGWIEFEGSCYFLTSTKSNWMKARSACVGKNADLAVITSENEQKFLSAKTGNTEYWIGLTDNEEEGKWTWVDGTQYSSSYKSWKPGEPSQSGNEDCAHMWTKGLWNDKICTHEHYFAICEKKIGI
ncbi:hepatic lectin-like isoform X2 [Hyperolius riggenbachi]|uniref:hepatic lectin-like isoform X2 n=1 Tax=Hyperolius riggenbachi TaxID=752182 RepID=UPI0035A3BB85